jgi:hypothetical protein
LEKDLKMAIFSRYKMLSASGSFTGIALNQLLSGRLKKYGVEWKENQGFFLISGNDGCLGGRGARGQVCKEFVVSHHPFPNSVVAAIKKEFNIEIVNKYDSRYWGCTSKEELTANVRKTGHRIDLLNAEQAASDETATSLEKRSLSSRVRRTLDIVDDRIDHELNECWEFYLSVPQVYK